ncbi:hypothetical protein JCM12296A_32710 [Desulfosarcina cetonica]|uniref:hypothetical protein n=1 Tax=Desulfosarcina cetonica TaxID=90730 RepID=UPI0012EE3539|nr:hypothetical protein [Desulfosarcina cetonica]
MSTDKIKDIQRSADILELHGKPDDIERFENRYEQWNYHFTIYKLISLECIQGEFHYVLTPEGKVINKDAQIITRKLELIPARGLPEAFAIFE